MLSVGSLFSGIGGFDLGLERAGGFRTAWFCEQDEFCRAVLDEHWPGNPCYPDICRLKSAEKFRVHGFGQPVQRVDVLCGGFPCQDISVAGAGAGLAGARSGLWSEYARLVGELRPRYVVVENVSALLGRGLGVVLGDLAALGYDAEWDCIPASAVGAPHQRDRVWLVAYPQRDELRQQPGWRSGPSGTGASLAAIDGAARPVADADDAGREQRRWPQPVRAEQPAAERCRQGVADADGMAGPACGACEGQRGEVHEPGTLERALGCRGGVWDQWSVEPDVGRVADGVPARVDRLRSLGNALVPQIAEWIGRRILDYEAGRQELAA